MDEIIYGAPLGPRATSIIPTDNFELLITFNNGEYRKFDVKDLFQYPMYKPLENIGFFKQVKLDHMCVYWNDEIDICPDTLYNMSIPVA